MTKTFAAVSAAALALVAMPAAAQDWQGGYVGIAGGYAMVDDEESETTPFDTDLNGTFGDTVRTTTGADAFSPGFCGGAPNSNNAAAGCQDDDDGQGEISFRAGYDWQSGPIVFGVVGEFTMSDASDTVTAFSITPAQYSFERSLDYMTAVRGRVGYDMGRFLPYVTAGGVYARLENQYNTSNGVNTFTPTSNGVENTGFQLGGGVEAQVTQVLRVGVEYLYTSIEDDSDFTVRVAGGPATSPFLTGNASGTDQRRSGSDFDTHAFRVTASFAF
jgi:opacity protein-like surface antigen